MPSAGPAHRFLQTSGARDQAELPKKVTCELFLQVKECFHAEKLCVGTGIQESMGSSGNDNLCGFLQELLGRGKPLELQ